MSTIDAGKYAPMLDDNYTKQLEDRRKTLDFWFGLCMSLYVAVLIATGIYSVIYFNLFDIMGLLQ
jgi:hypothetical protein